MLFYVMNKYFIKRNIYNPANKFRLLYIVLYKQYNTGIYLDEYTYLKVILDEQIGKICTSLNICRILR